MPDVTLGARALVVLSWSLEFSEKTDTIKQTVSRQQADSRWQLWGVLRRKGGQCVLRAQPLEHTCNRGVRPRWLFPPGGDKHFDVGVSSVPEPVHGQLDSPAREDFFIPMATMRKQRDL